IHTHTPPHPHTSTPPHTHSSFERAQQRYGRLLERAMGWRWVLVGGYLALAGLVIVAVAPQLGREMFPSVDTGQFRVRLRAPTGTRIEKTEQLLLQALDAIKQEVGPNNVAASLAFVGIQPSSYPINSLHLWTSGPEEAVLQVRLRQGAHIPVEPLKERLRARFARQVPEFKLSFEPADIVGQVMSFGSPTPIEIAVSGPNLADD